MPKTKHTSLQVNDQQHKLCSFVHHGICLTPLQNEAALANFTLKLRNFRPAATVLEAEIAKVKSTFTNPLLDADALKSKSNDVRAQPLSHSLTLV